ncbi:conserved hypothetical protein [Ricinus communis]|uniref:Reverse transcriptase n=1 Tax=Ricinus communis TaxID=3988 RepID=B9SJZ9_RICCO|nr:conserved hypothetical protein [Ricinus communis]
MKLNIKLSEYWYNYSECAGMKEIVETYVKASGKAVNLQKSALFFSSNVDQVARDVYCNILRVSAPLNTGRAGREALVKNVVQAIPTYWMSTFMIPTSLNDETQRMINSIWWGNKRDGRRGIN